MGNTNAITLKNNTNEVIDIIELRGIIPGKTVKAGGSITIQPEEYDGDDRRGGQLPILMIFCGGSILRSPKGAFLLRGDDLFSTCFETVTIDYQPEGQDSTGVVSYEVKFQPRDATFTVDSLKFSSDPVLDHDNGWSVLHFGNMSVKLTREGTTMTLDPSKLFASNIVNDPETSLLNMVLKFWPRTFADLKSKDDLGTTVCVVNDLMRQAKLYNVDRSKVEVAKVVEKVGALKELCTAKVEWYRPLFPGILFPGMEESPAEMMAEVDQEKLKRFETTIKDMLHSYSHVPNSLPGRSS